MGMMCARSGWPVEARPLASMRNSRSLRWAARNLLRIFVLAVIVTEFAGRGCFDAQTASAPLLLCHTWAGFLRAVRRWFALWHSREGEVLEWRAYEMLILC